MRREFFLGGNADVDFGDVKSAEDDLAVVDTEVIVEADCIGNEEVNDDLIGEPPSLLAKLDLDLDVLLADVAKAGFPLAFGSSTTGVLLTTFAGMELGAGALNPEVGAVGFKGLTPKLGMDFIFRKGLFELCFK